MYKKTIAELQEVYRTAPPNWRKYVAHNALKWAVAEKLIEEHESETEETERTKRGWFSTLIFWRWSWKL